MSAKRIIRDEMHRVTIEVLEASDFESLAQQRGEKITLGIEVWELAATDMARIRDKFVSDGWPDPDKCIVHNRQRFWAYRDELVVGMAGAVNTNGQSFISKHFEDDPLSFEYLSLRVFLSAKHFLVAYNNKELKDAVRFCAEYLSNREILTSRQSFLATVTTGSKVRKGSRLSAATTNALHLPLRERRFSRMQQLISELRSVDKAAVQCETEGLGKWDTIKRQWNRHRDQQKKKGT